jgi:hypothetical protein
MLELWSIPWHALQRSLAEAFGVEAPAVAPTGRVLAASDARAESGVATLVSGGRSAASGVGTGTSTSGVSASAEPLSWLARAHLHLRQTVS